MLKEIIYLCLSHLKCKVQLFNSRIKLLSVTWLPEFWKKQDRWAVFSPGILSLKSLKIQCFANDKRKVSLFLNITSIGTRKPPILNLQCTYLQNTHIFGNVEKPGVAQTYKNVCKFRVSAFQTVELELLSNTGYSKGFCTSVYLMTCPMWPWIFKYFNTHFNSIFKISAALHFAALWQEWPHCL